MRRTSTLSWSFFLKKKQSHSKLKLALIESKRGGWLKNVSKHDN